ncbi:hypothetical protein HZS_3291, partial [Henneguya salminicola]
LNGRKVQARKLISSKYSWLLYAAGILFYVSSYSRLIPRFLYKFVIILKAINLVMTVYLIEVDLLQKFSEAEDVSIEESDSTRFSYLVGLKLIIL